MNDFKAKLNTNYKGFKFFKKLIDDINKRIDNIKNDDNDYKTLEETVNNIFAMINNLSFKHNQEMKIESDTRKDNDTFLQTQINTEKTTRENADSELNEKIENEIQNRIDGDNAINNRLNNIQFLCWLNREDFGEKITDDKMYLGNEDWIKVYNFDDNKYLYTNTYVLSAKILLSTREVSYRLEKYGISIDIINSSTEENSPCQLQVTYKHADNIMGDNSGNNVIIHLLYTQFRTDSKPDIIPY